MNNPIQNEAETQELRREIPFRSALEDETNEGTSTSIKDPDRMLSMIVLVTCLPRARVPGARICLVTEPKQHCGDLFVTNVDRSNDASSNNIVELCSSSSAYIPSFNC